MKRDAAALARFAASWRPEVRLLEIEPCGSGLSGAIVCRCGWSDQRQTALRGWPRGTSRQRIAQVQAIVSEARRRGCDDVAEPVLAPGGEALLRWEGRYWEMAAWLPGSAWQPPRETSASGFDSRAWEASLREAAAAVGRFHAACDPRHVSRGVAPTVMQRLRRIGELRPWLCSDPPPRVVADFPASLREAGQLCRQIWAIEGRPLTAELEVYRSVALPLRPVLRDVHREHVLFSGDRVCGLIDFDAVRVDTAAADVARLVHSFACSAASAWPHGGIFSSEGVFESPPGSFQKNHLGYFHDWVNEELLGAAVAGLRQESSFSAQEASLARLLIALTGVLAPVNWMEWVAADRRSVTDETGFGLERVAARVDDLRNFAASFFLAQT